jgi:hypothetical protein
MKYRPYPGLPAGLEPAFSEKDRLLTQVDALLTKIETVHQTKDDQVTKALTDKDKVLADLLQKKWEMVEKLQQKYSDELERIATHCEEELKSITQTFKEQFDKLAEKVEGRNKNE